VQAFDGFKQAVKDHSQWKHALLRIAGRMLMSDVAHALHVWQSFIQLRRSQMAVATRHSHSQLLKKMLNAWAECVALVLVNREQRIRTFAGIPKHRLSHLRRCFTAWQMYAQAGGVSAVQQRLLAHCIKRKQLRYTRRAFSKWRQNAEHQREQKLTFLNKWGDRRMEAAFCTW
jgi:hypothetical protein